MWNIQHDQNLGLGIYLFVIINVHIIANIPNYAEECSSTSPVCGRRQTLGPDELCLQGRYGSSLFLLVVIPSGFGFGGSIPVIPARLAHGFARHPVNLRFSQEAYAVRGTLVPISGWEGRRPKNLASRGVHVHNRCVPVSLHARTVDFV